MADQVSPRTGRDAYKYERESSGEASTLMAEQVENENCTPVELKCWLDVCHPTRKNKQPLSQQEAERILLLVNVSPTEAELILAEATREGSDQQGTASQRQGDRTDKLGDTTDELANLTVSTESARQVGVGNVAGTFAPLNATVEAPAESSISMTMKR